MELGDLPELAIPETMSDKDNDLTLKAWRDQLICFCQDSDFYTFWSRESEFYNQVIDQFVIDSHVSEDLNKEISFLGISDMTVHFVLSPLIQDNLALVLNPSTKKEGFLILGLSGIQNGRLLFGDIATQSNLIQNDFLTLLVADVTKPFINDINKSQSLWSPIQTTMENFQIKTWLECFNRHLSLSIGIICFEDNQTEKLAEVNKQGFIYIQDSFDLLSQYSQYREYFPSVTTFLPRIMEQFNAIARRNQ
jgi:hypothetical protein